MNSTARRRLLIAVVVVVIAFAGGVIWLVRSQGAYYRQVSELGGGMDGQTVKVGGTVLPGSVTQNGDVDAFTIKDLTGQQATVQVEYVGTVPDTFGPGVDVVVLGTYDASQKIIAAEELQTKCPSKYTSSPSADAPAGQ